MAFLYFSPLKIIFKKPLRLIINNPSFIYCLAFKDRQLLKKPNVTTSCGIGTRFKNKSLQLKKKKPNKPFFLYFSQSGSAANWRSLEGRAERSAVLRSRRGIRETTTQAHKWHFVIKFIFCLNFIYFVLL